MPSLSSLFHHKKPNDDSDEVGARKTAGAEAEARAASQQQPALRLEEQFHVNVQLSGGEGRSRVNSKLRYNIESPTP
jgi:hypothetical protein